MLQTLAYPLSQLMPQAQLAGTFDSLATFQSPDAGQGPTGNPVGTFTNVAGLVNIPCMDAPPSILRVQATEVKAVSEIMSKGMRHMLLNKCFLDAPNWSGKGYRAVVDGIVYDLLGAENDSQNIQTRVDLQIVSV
jgi:hypothetical protein